MSLRDVEGKKKQSGTKAFVPMLFTKDYCRGVPFHNIMGVDESNDIFASDMGLGHVTRAHKENK